MRILPQFVPHNCFRALESGRQFVAARRCEQVMYEIESESENSETAMSFEFRNDMARMSFSEDNYFLVSEDDQYMVSRTEEGWQF